MDALIIAAGFGSRLRDLSDSKPLTPVAGVPLIELGVRQAHAAGAGRVTVVTGHEAAQRVDGMAQGVEAACALACDAVALAAARAAAQGFAQAHRGAAQATADAVRRLLHS